jgi:hypothetical protein
MCEQKLIAGGGFAMGRQLTTVGNLSNSGTATSDSTNTSVNPSTATTPAMVVSLTNSVPAGIRAASTAPTMAAAAIASATSTGVPALQAAHASWWANSFWASSMTSLPDAVFESFHAIQLYKVGSATRCDSPDNCWAMDLSMPWYVPKGHWHDYHWDLNVQMSYWLVLPSNHAQLGKSLVKMMERVVPYLIASVPPQYQNDSAALAANTGWIARASCQAFLLTNETVWCAFSDRNLHSRMPLVPTPARFK